MKISINKKSCAIYKSEFDTALIVKIKNVVFQIKPDGTLIYNGRNINPTTLYHILKGAADDQK